MFLLAKIFTVRRQQRCRRGFKLREKDTVRHQNHSLREILKPFLLKHGFTEPFSAVFFPPSNSVLRERHYLIFDFDDFLFPGNTPKISDVLRDLFARFPEKRTDIDEIQNAMPIRKFLFKRVGKEDQANEYSSTVRLSAIQLTSKVPYPR